MKMTNNLPMLEPLDQSNPNAGYMRRAMTPQDSTDSGIIERIMYGAKQGFISPEVAQYLMQNLLDDDQSSNAAIKQLAPAPQQPQPSNVVRPGLLNF